MGRCTPRDDTRRIRGVDDDLVVKPFQWKGNFKTVREFNRDASHNELGMQSVEIVGEDVDGDGDGVVNEFGFGDQSALAIYLAAQPRPVTKLELVDVGLVQVSMEERESISRGEALFEEIDCATCHKPALVIDDPIFSEPSKSASFRDDPFPAGQDPIAVGVDPDDPIWFDLTQDQPDNVIDMGGTEVRLGTLGVGSTAPYMHDGRSTTLTEAVLEHGGEARYSRRAFVRLSEQEQGDLIAFLNNLVLFKLE